MNFKPTKEMIDAAEHVLACKAFLQTVEPIVLEYQRKILADNQWHIAAEHIAAGDPDEIILKPNDTFLLGKEDAAKYYQLCDKAREASGLYVSNPRFCPLLVARDLLVKAENWFIRELEPIKGIKLDDVNLNMELRAQYLDISERFMVSYVDEQRTCQIATGLAQGVYPEQLQNRRPSNCKFDILAAMNNGTSRANW